MNKKLLILLLIILFQDTSTAQYLDKSNFYPMNPGMVNPAYMNPEQKASVYLSGRNHWTSLDGSPMDLYFGFNTPVMQNAGAGIRVIGDKQSIFKTYLTTLHYAYQHTINQDHTIQYGLSAGIQSSRLNMNDIITGTLTDPVLDKDYYNHTKFSAGMGIYYTYKNLFVSGVLPYLVQYDNFYRTFYGTVGYHYTLMENQEDEMLGLRPSLTIHKSPVSPLQYDINLLTSIKKHIVIQTSYITNQSFIAGVGFQYKDAMLGYAYEFSTGELTHLSNGSHEVLLTYQFEEAQSLIKKIFKRKKPIETEPQPDIQPAPKKDASSDSLVTRLASRIEELERLLRKDTARSDVKSETRRQIETDSLRPVFEAKKDESYAWYYCTLFPYTTLFRSLLSIERRSQVPGHIKKRAEHVNRHYAKAGWQILLCFH